jgi:hypothetical protein
MTTAVASPAQTAIPRFGHYIPLRTIAARYNEDKLTHTVTLGLSRPSGQLEPNASAMVMELRTFWDADRKTVVTQALSASNNQKLYGERFLDANGQLQQTLDPNLPRQTQMRLQQDIQAQETEHYQWVNHPGIVKPMVHFWRKLKRSFTPLPFERPPYESLPNCKPAVYR